MRRFVDIWVSPFLSRAVEMHETSDRTPLPSTSSTGSQPKPRTRSGNPAPSQCQLSGSATLDIAVFPEGSSQAEVFSQDCQAGATTIDLPDGRYTGSAHLADGNGPPAGAALPPQRAVRLVVVS